MDKIKEKKELEKYLEDNGLHMVKKSEFETLFNVLIKIILYVFILVEVYMMKRI